EEIRRTVPVIERVRAALPDMPISVDTYKPQVAHAALRAGAHLVNDITVLRGDPTLARIAADAGVPQERLIVDPGFGFGWQPEENIEMLRRLGELRALRLPLLIGTSRKSTIATVLGGGSLDDRVWGTAASVALAIAGGADIIRVHDVAAMKRVALLSDAVVRGYPR